MNADPTVRLYCTCALGWVKPGRESECCRGNGDPGLTAPADPGPNAAAWVVPKVQHDESRLDNPLVRNGRVIYDAERMASPEQARLYAAQLLAAADAAEARKADEA